MLIYSVTQVIVITESKSPLKLNVHAFGLASSTNWTNPRLKLINSNPEDGILEFNFEADRPSGISLPVLTPIQASAEVAPGLPVYAVTVHARTNSHTVHVSHFAGPDQQFATLMVGEGHPTQVPSSSVPQPREESIAHIPTPYPPGPTATTTPQPPEEAHITTVPHAEEGYATTPWGESGGPFGSR